MIKEAENIILSKEYFELTAEELATVSDLVQNAEEYDEMKWFLMSSQEALAGSEIKPSPKLREKVMAHLHQDEKQRKFWLNGVVPFFLPEDKKFYQKPAFHVGMAALIVVGFFIFSPAQIKNDSVAMNERGGGDKDFGVVEEHLVADEEIMENEEALAQELIVESNEDADANASFAPIVDEVEEVAVEEVVDPMYDGYYEGDLTVDDLKRIERAKTESRGDMTTTISTGATDKTDISSNDNNTNSTGNVPATVVDNANVDVPNDDKLDDKPGNFLAKEQKNAKNNRDNRKDRFAKKAEVNQNPAVVLAEDDQLAGGAYQQHTDSLSQNFNFKTEIAEKELLDGKLKEKSEIRPYSMHVNETKELKKLFTVFK